MGNSKDTSKRPLWQIIGWKREFIGYDDSRRLVLTQYRLELPEGDLIARSGHSRASEDRCKNYELSLVPPYTAYPREISDLLHATDPSISIDTFVHKESIFWSGNAGELCRYRSKFYTLPRSLVRIIKKVLDHPERLEFRQSQKDAQLESVDDALAQESLKPYDYILEE